MNPGFITKSLPTLTALFIYAAFVPLTAVAQTIKELPAAMTNATPAITNQIPWLDSLHAQDCERVTRSVNRVDSLFADNGTAILPLTNSSLRLRPEIEVRDLEDPEVKARMNVQANINMPNFENRLHLFINNLAPDRLPDENPFSRNNDIYVGFRKITDIRAIPALDTRLGARWHSGPVAFARAELSHCFSVENWNIYPGQSAYWYTDDGLGEKTSLVVERWTGDNTLLQSTTAGVYGESSNGFEWEQSVLIDHIFHGTRETRTKAVSTQFSSFGHSDDRSIVDAYRWDVLSLRTPAYSDWLFLEITPSVEWTNDNNWEPVWTIALALDDYFQ